MNKLKLICLKPPAALTQYARGFVAVCLIMIAFPSHSTDPARNTNSHALVFLVDSSLSMKTAEAAHRVPEMIRTYVRSMPDDTRLSLITYDDLASVLVPLSGTRPDDHETLLHAARQLEFSAQHSNVGAGLERALFELGTYAGNASARAVLLVHAGTIDTGDTEQDRSFQRWTGVVLANKAKEQSIPIYVLTLGNRADQGLSKRLAASTYGAHRHAASVVDDPTNIDALKGRFLAQVELAGEFTPAHEQSTDTIISEHAMPLDTTLDQGDGQGPQPAGTLKTLAEIDNQIVRFPADAGISKTSTAGRAGTGRFILPSLAPNAGQDEHKNSVPARIVSTPEDASQSALFDEQTLRIAGVAIFASGVAGLIVFTLRRKSGRDRNPGAMSLLAEREAILTDINGITGQNRYVITERLVRICRESGRNSLNVVCLTIPDEVISREHAFIEYRDNDYWVTDTGSNNGTFLNGTRVKGTRKLKHGDRLRFATYEFLFGQAAAQPAVTRMTDPADATLVTAGPSMARQTSDDSTRLGGVRRFEDDVAGASQDDSSPSKTLVEITDPEDLQSDETQIRIPPA